MGFISTDAPAVTADRESYQIGEPIDITFYGVMNKDAWIGLYRSETAEYERCETGMWCYAATGKQWVISKSMNTVRNGKVRLYANILDNYTGTKLDLEPGLYKMVLFQNAGYTPSAISDAIQISDY